MFLRKLSIKVLLIRIVSKNKQDYDMSQFLDKNYLGQSKSSESNDLMPHSKLKESFFYCETI